MIPLVVIRPQPGCDATVAAARALGLAVEGFPLFAVEPVAWQAPDRDSFDALLLGSAHALAQAGPALANYAGKPAYTVGERTAEAASAAGLAVAEIGCGGLQGVLDAVEPGHRRLLRLAGRARVPLALPPGIVLDERVVYASEPYPMPAALVALLDRPSVVMLHSAEAARHFAAQCDAHGRNRAAIALIAIGLRAAAAGDGWAGIAVAREPRDAAMLALATQMCQTANGSA